MFAVKKKNLLIIWLVLVLPLSVHFAIKGWKSHVVATSDHSEYMAELRSSCNRMSVDADIAFIQLPSFEKERRELMSHSHHDWSMQGRIDYLDEQIDIGNKAIEEAVQHSKYCHAYADEIAEYPAKIRLCSIYYLIVVLLLISLPFTYANIALRFKQMIVDGNRIAMISAFSIIAALTISGYYVIFIIDKHYSY